MSRRQFDFMSRDVGYDMWMKAVAHASARHISSQGWSLRLGTRTVVRILKLGIYDTGMAYSVGMPWEYRMSDTITALELQVTPRCSGAFEVIAHRQSAPFRHVMR